MSETVDEVMLAAAFLLQGEVLSADGVTVGNGALFDWRTVRSGEDVTEEKCRHMFAVSKEVEGCSRLFREWESELDTSAFGLAYAFRNMVGREATIEALKKVGVIDG